MNPCCLLSPPLLSPSRAKPPQTPPRQRDHRRRGVEPPSRAQRTPPRLPGLARAPSCCSASMHHITHTEKRLQSPFNEPRPTGVAPPRWSALTCRCRTPGTPSPGEPGSPATGTTSSPAQRFPSTRTTQVTTSTVHRGQREAQEVERVGWGPGGC